MRPNYEIKRTPEVTLRSNHHLRPAPLISALAFAGDFVETNVEVADQAPEPEDPKSVLRWLIVVAVLVGAAVILSYLLEFGWAASPKQEHWGQFGDFVGGLLNSLFSFLALLALIITISMQYRQLDYSRRALISSSEELQLTRKELEKAGAAQAQLAAASADQVAYAAMSARLSALSEAYRVTCDLVSQYNTAPSNPTMSDYWVEKKEKIAAEILNQIKSMGL